MDGFIKKYAVLMISSLSAFAATAMAGPGDLLVSPVRVTFEGRDRVAELTLVNKGDAPANYRISFVNRRMNDDGSFEAIEAPTDGELFSESMVRYAPRSVSLAPNAPQTLRLMLRKPTELAEGEYRSHLHLAAVPDDAGSASVEAASGNADGISIQLKPIYGVTIPVIVRHGALSADAEISALSFAPSTDGAGELTLRLERNGTKSLYGDLELLAAGSDKVVASMRGLAVYTPNTFRDVTFSIPAEAAAEIRGRPIEVRFADRGRENSGILASATAGPVN